jgi:hypothetical protein
MAHQFAWKLPLKRTPSRHGPILRRMVHPPAIDISIDAKKASLWRLVAPKPQRPCMGHLKDIEAAKQSHEQETVMKSHRQTIVGWQ